MADVQTDQARAGRGPRTQVDPTLLGLLPLVILLLGALPLLASSPWCSLLLTLPLGCALWVARARVVLDAEGMLVCNGLGQRRVGWRDVDAVEVWARRPVRLVLRDGDRLALTALSRRQVPVLLSAAQAAGRHADLAG